MAKHVLDFGFCRKKRCLEHELVLQLSYGMLKRSRIGLTGLAYRQKLPVV